MICVRPGMPDGRKKPLMDGFLIPRVPLAGSLEQHYLLSGKEIAPRPLYGDKTHVLISCLVAIRFNYSSHYLRQLSSDYHN